MYMLTIETKGEAKHESYNKTMVVVQIVEVNEKPHSKTLLATKLYHSQYYITN